jgi:hypothetical protein
VAACKAQSSNLELWNREEEREREREKVGEVVRDTTFKGGEVKTIFLRF